MFLQGTYGLSGGHLSTGIITVNIWAVSCPFCNLRRQGILFQEPFFFLTGARQLRPALNNNLFFSDRTQTAKVTQKERKGPANR